MMPSKRWGCYPINDCERLQEILAIVDDLIFRAERGAIIMVEGLRDKASLEALGISGNIVMASQQPLFNLAERISRQNADVIILTDWDERGEEVAKYADIFLKSNGARPDCEPRKRLRQLSKKEIKDIENLHGYIERLKLICDTKQADVRR